MSSNLAIGVLRKRGRARAGLPEVNTPALAAVLDGLGATLDVRAGLMALPLRRRRVVVVRYIG